MSKAMNTQIKHLNEAAKRHTGMSFLSMTYKGHFALMDVVHEAMQEYALACLEKAAENAKPTLLPCGIFADLAPKESITNKDNLI